MDTTNEKIPILRIKKDNGEIVEAILIEDLKYLLGNSDNVIKLRSYIG